MAGPSSAFQYFRIFRSLSFLLDTQQFSSNIADSRNVGDNWSVSMLHSEISIAGRTSLGALVSLFYPKTV